MKFSRCCLVFGLGLSLASAAVINDGSTTDGLVQVVNPGPDVGVTSLVVVGETNLEANVVQRAFDFPAAHTAWYSVLTVATGATYSASANYLPAADTTLTFPERQRGGVVGWYDPATGLGLTLSLLPDSSVPEITLEEIDFPRGRIADGQSFGHLYDTNGTRIVSGFPEAWKVSLNGSYQPGEFLTLEMAFELPGDDDVTVLPEVTARITAKAKQQVGGSEVTVSDTIELLTDLAVPEPDERYIGYYACYRSLEFVGVEGAIGRLDSLAAGGDVGVANQLPEITLTSPADGAAYASSDSIPLSADASDPDGQVVEVEFRSGDEVITVLTAEPFAYDWTDAVIGSHVVTAVATDDKGAQRTSNSAMVAVTNLPPMISITGPANGSVLAPGSTIVITAEASDVDGEVVEVEFFDGTEVLATFTAPPYTFDWIGATVGSHTLTAVAKDDRDAVTTSEPVTIEVREVSTEPAELSIASDGTTITLNWDRLGFQVRVSDSAVGPFVEVAEDTTGKQTYSETMSGQPRYFSLLQKGGGPSGPILSMEVSGNNLVIRWNETGRQLQSVPALGGSWEDVTTDTTALREYTAPLSSEGSNFYRLR